MRARDSTKPWASVRSMVEAKQNPETPKYDLSTDRIGASRCCFTSARLRRNFSRVEVVDAQRLQQAVFKTTAFVDRLAECFAGAL